VYVCVCLYVCAEIAYAFDEFWIKISCRIIKQNETKKKLLTIGDMRRGEEIKNGDRGKRYSIIKIQATIATIHGKFSI